VQFPDGHRPASGGRYVDANSEPASVIILPVVRIERDPDQPSDGLGRRQQRRAGPTAPAALRRVRERRVPIEPMIDRFAMASRSRLHSDC